MKKSVILNLSLTVFAVALCGCRTFGVGPSDEELVSTTMAEWKAAMVAKDLDKLMATFSENYLSSRGSGKDAMRERMAGAIERGFLDSIEVNIENAQITIEGDKATFSPVEFTSDRGTMALEYTLQKENGAWLIVSSKRQEQ
jgi:ketosteroid isomerase-like protein